VTARVLIVDDVPLNVKLLQAKLEAEYFDVVTAESGRQALERVAEDQPDIILLDVMMPGMDGFEVCETLKGDARTAHLPIVIVTALSDTGDRVRGLEAGADDFITKPIDDVALLARVRSLVRLKLMTDELRLRRETSERLGLGEGGEPITAVDHSGGRVLLLDDGDFTTARILEPLEADGHTIDVFEDAEAALAKAQQGELDLAIVPFSLTATDPLRLCAQLRGGDNSRHLPILIVIEEIDKQRMAKALEIGVTDYLKRPIEENELIARVRTQIRRRRYHDGLRSDYRRNLELSLVDTLTGVYNRRYLDAHLASLAADRRDANRSLTVLLLDIDHFKNVNDCFGHGAGDQVLRAVADRLRDGLRSVDSVARLGGEEFVVLMPEAGAEVGARVAERLRAAIAEEPVRTDAGDIPVTVSVGLAEWAPQDAGDSVIARADEAMYDAKQGGRNRIVIAPDAGPGAAGYGTAD